MILYGRVVDQPIDRDERASFRKEIVVTSGPVPLAMVRKRLETPLGADRATSDDGTLAPVLLVHGFGQNRYAWHLPSRSFANHLAARGFDVFNLDLRGHGRSRSLGARRCDGVHQYITEDLPAAVAEVQALSGGRPVFLVGHSLGGLCSYAAAPDLGSAVRGIVSVGSPYHFTRGSFSLGAIAPFFRALAGVRSSVGRARFPMAALGGTLRAFRGLAESSLYPLPWRAWHAGSCEPHIIEEHLRLAFDGAAIAEMIDMFEWANAKSFGGAGSDYAARFEDLDVPLLVVAGANDDLAPPASVRPGFQRSRARDKTYRALPLGHIDLLVGRDAPLTTWPLLTDWLTRRAA